MIIAVGKFIDMDIQLVNRIERCAGQRFAAQDYEPDFDLVKLVGIGGHVVDVEVPRQTYIVVWFVGREVVEGDVDFAVRIVSDNLVHEVEKFDPPAPFVIPPHHLTGSDVKRGEQCRHSLPIVVVRLADHSAASGQVQISLGAFKSLNTGFVIGRENQGIHWRRHV